MSNSGVLLPAYYEGQVSSAALTNVTIAEIPSAGPVNNLPVGLYLVAFVEDDLPLTDPATWNCTGAAFVSVTNTGVNTYAFSGFGSVGTRVLTNGTPGGGLPTLVINSTQIYIYFSGSALWRIIKLI